MRRLYWNKFYIRYYFGMQEVNVQVAVRVRPLLPKEEHARERICVRVMPSTNQIVLGKDRAFTFDYVLSSKVSQKQLYDQCVNPLVRSCLEGYNATVFAYGQTGSGKTFTMGGGCLLNLTEDDLGIIPRAIQQIFDGIAINASRNFVVRVSYIEIYKEELHDLLDLDNIAKDLHIREDNNGNTVIVGVTELECDTVDDVMSYLERGSTYRRTGLTQMNEHSSRSHSVFTLIIEQRWSDNVESRIGTSKSRRKSDASEDNLDEHPEVEHYMCGKFHFVDLAGSERANRTGNVGERFKESVHINGGLLALGNVISALSDSKRRSTTSHIPYRDSKITRLLKDSLGGNAKTMMICCISPSEASFDETLNSLKYANRARNIKNVAIVNRDPQSLRFEEMQSEIKALREELHRQRTAVVVTTTSLRETAAFQQDSEQYKQLKENHDRVETERLHYQMLTDQAYSLLVKLRDRDALSQSSSSQLCDWIELVEEMKNSVSPTLNTEAWSNKTIRRLESELEQCKSDLKCDEEIFAEKARSMENMQRTIEQLQKENNGLKEQLDATDERVRQLDELVLAKQIELDNLAAQMKTVLASQERHHVNVSTAAAGNSLDFIKINSSVKFEDDDMRERPRAVSVPAHFMSDSRPSLNKQELMRDIHSSPAAFSVGRIINCFRARSALLVSRLEDRDEVLQKTFSDSDNDEKMEDADDLDMTDDDKVEFLRGDEKRSTYRVKASVHLNRPTVEPNRLRKPQEIPSPTTSRSFAAAASAQQDDFASAPAANEWATKRNKTKIIASVNGTATAAADDDDDQDISRLRVSTDMRSRQLRQTQLDVRQSTQKMKDLRINIRLKEQLIKELVKTGNEAERINADHMAKIQMLEDEKGTANAELAKLQKLVTELMSRENNDKQEKEQLLGQYRKKMDAAKLHIQSLKKKQKEAEKFADIANMSTTNNKKVQELEMAVANMRAQHDQLQRHLKDVSDQKLRLEREIQREQQKIRELEMSSEQNRRVLRVKMDELSAMQRRLRGAGISVSATPISDEQSRFDDQRRWLDQEMEMILQQRKAMEELEKELHQREDIIAKKEAMLAEKNELEIKKLRSSQASNKISQDIVRMSNRMESVERLLEEKTREMSLTSSHGQMHIREEMESLRQARDKLHAECGALQARAGGLSSLDERRLVELEEEVEALDAAIEFKNECIASFQQDVRQSVALRSSKAATLNSKTASDVGSADTNNRLMKLRMLSATELRSLLARYFDRIVDLRDGQRKMQNNCTELEMKVDEQLVRIAELEAMVEKSAMDADRRLTQQQQEYERRIQLLMKQVSDTDRTGHSEITAQIAAKDARISELEKDLFYYKSTSRELKKKLRHATRDKDAAAAGGGEPGAVNDVDRCEYVDTPREQQQLQLQSSSVAKFPSDASAQDSASKSSRPTSARDAAESSRRSSRTSKSSSVPPARDMVLSPSTPTDDSFSHVMPATKSVTPRDVLNNASVRGDLFPRLSIPPNSKDGAAGSVSGVGLHSRAAAAAAGDSTHHSSSVLPADSASSALVDARLQRLSSGYNGDSPAIETNASTQRSSHRRSSKDVLPTRRSKSSHSHEHKQLSAFLADSLDGAIN